MGPADSDRSYTPIRDEPDKFPFHPVAETSTSDGLWTLWATDTGVSGGSGDYAITKDGEQPENPL